MPFADAEVGRVSGYGLVLWVRCDGVDLCEDDDDATVILPDAANASASASDLNRLCFAPGKLFTWASQSALCGIR